MRQPPPELFQAASVCLRYPTPELVAADPELREAAAAFPRRAREPLLRFLDHRAATPLLDLERAYVETFDSRRRLSLSLTYYVEGDTRRRGISLLRLKRLYAAAGLVLESGELPDHLPVMLEFAAFAPVGHGRRVLEQHRLGIELLRRGLHDAGSPHADVLDAVSAALPRLGVREAGALRRLAAQGPPDERVGLEPFAPPDVMPTGARP